MPDRTPKPPPFSLRLTPEERARLAKDAGDMPLGAYIKDRLFSGRGRSASAVDRKTLARLTGLLGQSDLAPSLRILAQAAKSGALPVTSETENALLRACADIAAMKSLLMGALGIRES